MSLVGNLSGTSGVTYITGALHLTGGLDGAVTTPYIAIETIASGSLTNVGGVTDKIHNRNGVLYFGAVSLEGGITMAGDTDNAMVTTDGDGTFTSDANFKFDGTDALIAGAGKVQFRDAGGEYVKSAADNILEIAAGTHILVKTQALSSSGGILSTGYSTSGGIIATGSISGSSTIQAVGNAYIGGTLNVTGNADFDGTITCDDSITIDSVTITDTEIGYLDGLTLGTVAASKVITVDSSKDFAGHRNMSGSGILQNVGAVIVGGTLNVTGNIDCNGNILPTGDNSLDLGSAAKRWQNVFTGDLHLANDRGDWTVIEEPEFLSLRNNSTGKRYKLSMEEITGDGSYGPGNDGQL